MLLSQWLGWMKVNSLIPKEVSNPRQQRQLYDFYKKGNSSKAINKVRQYVSTKKLCLLWKLSKLSWLQKLSEWLTEQSLKNIWFFLLSRCWLCLLLVMLPVSFCQVRGVWLKYCVCPTDRLEQKSTWNKSQIEKLKNKIWKKAEQRLSSRRGLWFKSYPFDL